MWRLGIVPAAAILATAHPSVALDWFNECTDWPSRVPSAVPDPEKDHVFVAMGKCETVLAIDTESVRIVAAQRAGDGGDPTHFAASPDGKTIILAHWDENRVTAHEAATWQRVFEAPTGKKPVHLTVTPNGRFLYVTNAGSGDLTVVDIPARKVVAAIAVGDEPLGLIASGDGRRVLVAVMGDDTVVDVASQAVIRRIEAEGEPQHMTLARDGRTVYVTMPHEGRVDVLDAIDLEWRARIETGPSPQQIAPRYADR